MQRKPFFKFGLQTSCYYDVLEPKVILYLPPKINFFQHKLNQRKAFFPKDFTCPFGKQRTECTILTAYSCKRGPLCMLLVLNFYTNE